MKKWLCLIIAAALLLAGCGQLQWLPETQQEPSGEAAGQPEPEPETLWVCLQDGVAMPDSVAAYARARGIQLAETPDPAQAGLVLLAAYPREGCRPLGGETLLAGAAGLQADSLAAPVAQGRYGYLANTGALREMLGGADAMQDLCAAGYDDWEAFVEAASKWIARPRAQTVTVNGTEYTFAEQKGPETGALDDVFAVDCREGFGALPLSPALAAAGEGAGRDALTGPLNSVWYTFRLETDHLAGAARGGEAIATIDAATARASFAAGEALFLRGSAGTQAAMVPVKFNFEDSDITAGGWTVQALAQTGIETVALWGAIPADAPPERAGQGLGYLLWLHTSRSSPLQADPARTIPQAALTPEQEQEINAALVAGLEEKAWNTAGRKAYVEYMLNILAPEQPEA